MTGIMKIDLVGPRRRSLALRLNEFAGYFAVGVMSWMTGYVAGHYAFRKGLIAWVSGGSLGNCSRTDRG
jgi:hypothetical protein